ncbi:hypothetical protein [Prevotella bivia]|uniref:hypothetical protein n=1 Tax=Prevotella bivia TaxID=28125 RepID=UPI00288B5D5C|nr:hypothetical protein [Prevotella bivia]
MRIIYYLCTPKIKTGDNNNGYKTKLIPRDNQNDNAAHSLVRTAVRHAAVRMRQRYGCRTRRTTPPAAHSAAQRRSGKRHGQLRQASGDKGNELRI